MEQVLNTIIANSNTIETCFCKLNKILIPVNAKLIPYNIIVLRK